MRVVVDLSGTSKSVAGTALMETGELRSFAGWLELMRVLEDVVEAAGTTDRDVAGGKRNPS